MRQRKTSLNGEKRNSLGIRSHVCWHFASWAEPRTPYTPLDRAKHDNCRLVGFILIFYFFSKKVHIVDAPMFTKHICSARPCSRWQTCTPSLVSVRFFIRTTSFALAVACLVGSMCSIYYTNRKRWDANASHHVVAILIHLTIFHTKFMNLWFVCVPPFHFNSLHRLPYSLIYWEMNRNEFSISQSGVVGAGFIRLHIKRKHKCHREYLNVFIRRSRIRWKESERIIAALQTH